MSKPDNYNPWGPHHYYSGGIVLTAGFICIFYCSKWVAIPLLTVGGLLVLDDVLQHLHQGHDIWWWKKNPDFVSPVHRGYWHTLNWLIPKTPEGSWIRRLLEWMRTV